MTERFAQPCHSDTQNNPPQNHEEEKIPKTTESSAAIHVEPLCEKDTAAKSSAAEDHTIFTKLSSNEQAKLDASTKKEPDPKGVHRKRVSQLGSMARKKRKSQLADMSAAVTTQPVKLNTLEKSKLDWEAYKGNVACSDNKETMPAAEREELEAQTQGGGSGLGDVKGYLHRKDFLDRVHDRLNTQEYEAHLAGK